MSSSSNFIGFLIPFAHRKQFNIEFLSELRPLTKRSLMLYFLLVFFEAFSAHFARTIVIKEANQRWKSIDNDDVVDDELGEAALEQIAQMLAFPQIPN